MARKATTTWIPVDAQLRDNKKIKRLRSLLSMDKYAVMGHMVAFWGWCLTAADRDGLLVACTADDLAEAFGWAGDPETLVAAMGMNGAQLLEVTATGIVVHDWDEWAAPWYTLQDKRASNAASMARSRGDAADPNPEPQLAPPCDTPCAPQRETQSGTPITLTLDRNQDQEPLTDDDDDAPAREEVPGPAEEPPRIQSYDHYQKTIGLLAPLIREAISSYLNDGMEDALICEAINQAVTHGARQWAYINKILDNCAQQSVLTLDKYRALQVERENAIAAAKARASPGVGQVQLKDFAERDYAGQRSYSAEDFTRLTTKVEDL